MPNIIKITDFLDPRLDTYVRLTGAQLRNKLEPQKGIFIAESPTVIEVALNAGYEPVSLLTDERLLNDGVRGIIERLEKHFPDAPVFTADRETLEKLTGFELTRGALCAMKRPVPLAAESVCRDARRIAVLENIVDASNLGAIFRSAAAIGIDGIILSPSCCDPLYRKAVRTSMGTVFQIPWCRFEGHWPDEGVQFLKGHGFKTVSLALNKEAMCIDDPLLAGMEKLALILGTEGTGLDERTIQVSDHSAYIPMHSGVDSLNVAAAAAIAFWQLRAK